MHNTAPPRGRRQARNLTRAKPVAFHPSPFSAFSVSVFSFLTWFFEQPEIYGAATDGTNRLRYFCGEDTGGLVRARREMVEEQFIEFMRVRFRP
jgi:hypothetical protein